MYATGFARYCAMCRRSQRLVSVQTVQLDDGRLANVSVCTDCRVLVVVAPPPRDMVFKDEPEKDDNQDSQENGKVIPLPKPIKE